MKAFHGDHKLKSDLLKELEEHRRLDMITQSLYGFGKPLENGETFRGCAVGCSIRSLHRLKGTGTDVDYDDRKWYAKQIDVPEYLIAAEEYIFESFDPKKEKEIMLSFPIRFIESLNVGTDYSDANKVVVNKMYGEVTTVSSRSDTVAWTAYKAVNNGWLGSFLKYVKKDLIETMEEFLSILRGM